MKHFDSLGIMIDCSRNAVMKPESVCRYIDILAKLGYTTLQLYTEDTYEVDGEPYFGYLRGRYTTEELQSIDAYAKEKGIELIPCIQTLAHLNAIFRWAPYGGIKDWDDILLIGDPRTYELLDHIFASLRKSFTTKQVHLGMDEAYLVGLGRYRQINGIRERFEIMAEHLAKVCEIAKKYGFEPMLWNDMFYHLSRDSGKSAQEIQALIPDQVKLVYWDYYSHSQAHYEEKIRENKAICPNVIFAGGAWCWGGFAPSNEFSIKATKAAFSACIKEGVRSAFLTMWGDDGAECSAFSVLPSLVWGACLAEDENATIDMVRAKFKEAIGEDYDDFILLDMPNQIGVEGASINNPAKYLVYSDPFSGHLDYTVDDNYAPHFEETSCKLSNAAKRSVNYRYLFETLATLCDYLSIKADLGKKTRAYYQSGNKEGLRDLAEHTYPLCIEKLEVFAQLHFKQWMTDSKPHGFEVLDIRYGGMKERLRKCAERILAYLNGQVEEIPELSAEILPFGRGAEGDSMHYNLWSYIASSNVISHNCK